MAQRTINHANMAKRNKHELWVTLDPYESTLRPRLEYITFYNQKYGGPEHVIKTHDYPLHIFFDRHILHDEWRVKIPVCVFDGNLRRPLGVAKAYDTPEILHQWKSERHIDRLRKFGVPVFLISDYSQECLTLVVEEIGDVLLDEGF